MIADEPIHVALLMAMSDAWAVGPQIVRQQAICLAPPTLSNKGNVDGLGVWRAWCAVGVWRAVGEHRFSGNAEQAWDRGNAVFLGVGLAVGEQRFIRNVEQACDLPRSRCMPQTHRIYK